MRSIPQHVAIIMDGSGRWAQRKLLPRVAGHHQGVEAARRTVQTAMDLQIPVLTLFAFSSENWQRPASEVKVLMELLYKMLSEEVTELHKNNVKLVVLGDKNGLSAKLQLAIKSAESMTLNNTGLQLNIALNYGGRWDILQAAKQLHVRIASGELSLDHVSEQDFAKELSTAGLPEPDLLIRTSGEQRISNFLLWQLAYTELYFTDTLWPNFALEDLQQALEFYAMRQRRFGMVENV